MSRGELVSAIFGGGATGRRRLAALLAVVGCAALALPSAASAVPERAPLLPPLQQAAGNTVGTVAQAASALPARLPLVPPLPQAAGDAVDTVTQAASGATDATTRVVPAPAADQPAASTGTPPAGAAAKPAAARNADPTPVRARRQRASTPARRTTRSAQRATPRSSAQRRPAARARRTAPARTAPVARPTGRTRHAPEKRSRGVVNRITRSVDRLVEHLPDWSRPIIAILLALVLALGLRALVTGRRARALESTRRSLRADIDVLQAALVPELEERIGASQVSVAYRPADGLASGGDFYDAFALDDDRTAIVVGDVSGHDRLAISRASAVRHKLRAYLELGLGPRAVLHAAGEALASDSSDGEFATAVVAIHDARDGTLTFACAGHPPPILTGAAAHDPVLVCSSAPLGWGLPTGRRQTTVVLGGRDAAWFFTDGLTEARHDGAFLEREGLQQIVADLGEAATAGDLLTAVREHALATGDDLAALAIRSTAPHPSSSARIEEVELDAGDVARKTPARFLAACDAPAATIDAIAEQVGIAVERDGRAVVGVRFEGTAVAAALEASHAQAASTPVTA